MDAMPTPPVPATLQLELALGKERLGQKHPVPNPSKNPFFARRSMWVREMIRAHLFQRREAADE